MAEVPTKVVDVIAEKSDGNPFWVKEFVKSMVEDNMISDDGKLQVDDIADIDFPSSVEGLVTSRMDRLPAALQLTMKVTSAPSRAVTRRHAPSHGARHARNGMERNGTEPACTRLREPAVTCRHTPPMQVAVTSRYVPVQVASVLDADFTKSMVGSLADQLLLELDLAGVDQLCAAEMLVHSGTTYSYKHKYLQDVSYSLLPEELKEKLHRAAAEYFERLNAKVQPPLVTWRYLRYTRYASTSHGAAYRRTPSHTVTYRHAPSHTVTHRHIPSRTVTYRYIPLHAVTGAEDARPRDRPCHPALSHLETVAQVALLPLPAAPAR